MSGGVRGNIVEPKSKFEHIDDPEGPFRAPAQITWVRLLLQALKEAFRTTVSTETAVPQFYLRSPNGQAWRVTVGDDGVLSVVNARG